MSLDQQPAHADTAPERRSASERAVVIVSVVVTVLAAIGLAVIGTSRDDMRAPSAPTPAAVVENSAQPVAPDQQAPAKTPNDLAAEAAVARYREYLRVDDEVGQGGYQSSAPYDSVSVPPERTYLEVAFRQAQAANARAIGHRSLASLSVTSVNLTPEPGDYPEVVLQACVDVSRVDVVDVNGESLVRSDRVSRTASTVTMYEYEPGTPGAEKGGWYVYEATSTGEPC